MKPLPEIWKDGIRCVKCETMINRFDFELHFDSDNNDIVLAYGCNWCDAEYYAYIPKSDFMDGETLEYYKGSK